VILSIGSSAPIAIVDDEFIGDIAGDDDEEEGCDDGSVGGAFIVAAEVVVLVNVVDGFGTLEIEVGGTVEGG
jgi:hypothetical protein